MCVIHANFMCTKRQHGSLVWLVFDLNAVIIIPYFAVSAALHYANQNLSDAHKRASEKTNTHTTNNNNDNAKHERDVK